MIVFLLLLAPVIGSFLGVIIRRTARGESFVAGRSHCESCRRALGIADLVPIVSFLALRGRCRTCRAPIGRFHLFVEVAAIGVPASAILAGADGWSLVAGCILGWTLLTLGWIDALTFRLPDFLTLPLVLAGLAAGFLIDPDELTDRAAGAAGGYAAFRLLAWVYRWARGRDGLGQGDAKLLAAAGAWVGLAALTDVVLAAALSALLFAGMLAVMGRRVDATTRLPFGPFLAAGTWLVWLIAPGT